MEQFITHACGHAQAHYLSGFASQQERKARWLQTTKCRTCFSKDKQTKQAEAAVLDNTAVSHLGLPQLTGTSDRLLGQRRFEPDGLLRWPAPKQQWIATTCRHAFQ